MAEVGDMVEVGDFVVGVEDENVALILEVLAAPANLPRGDGPRGDAESVGWLAALLELEDVEGGDIVEAGSGFGNGSRG